MFQVVSSQIGLIDMPLFVLFVSQIVADLPCVCALLSLSFFSLPLSSSLHEALVFSFFLCQVQHSICCKCVVVVTARASTVTRACSSSKVEKRG